MKNALVHLGARALVFVLGRLPEALVRAVGGALGALGFSLARRERALAEAQLRRALRLDAAPSRVRLLARAVFAHLGTSAVEVSRALRDPESLCAIVFPEPSRRVLESALAERRGVVLATGHIGNWELLAGALAHNGFPLTAVVRASYDPGITRSVERARRRLGVETIHREGPGTAAAMLRALRRGRILGLLIDQDTRAPGGFVPFFGAPAFTPTGAAVLAMRTGAPLLVGTIRRTARGGHVVDMERCAPPDDALAATAAVTAVLERAIRRHPSQWVWIHDRWRTRP
jgi:Kdo2-lipid IVA lauroyltransferase/acyltransferase